MSAEGLSAVHRLRNHDFRLKNDDLLLKHAALYVKTDPEQAAAGLGRHWYHAVRRDTYRDAGEIYLKMKILQSKMKIHLLKIDDL